MDRKRASKERVCPAGGSCNNSPQPLADHEMNDNLLSELYPKTDGNTSILTDVEMDENLVAQKQMSESEYSKWLATHTNVRGTRPSRIPVRIRRPSSSYKRPTCHKTTASKTSVQQNQPRRSRIPVPIGRNVPRIRQQSEIPGEGVSMIATPIKTDNIDYPTRRERRNYFREPTEGPPNRPPTQNADELQNPPKVVQCPSKSGKLHCCRQASRIPRPIIHDRIKLLPSKSPKVRPQMQVQPPNPISNNGGSSSEPPQSTCESCCALPLAQTEVTEAGCAPSSYITPAPNQCQNEEDFDEEEDFEYEECAPCKAVVANNPYNLEWRKEQLKKIPVGEGAGPESGYIETTHPAILSMCRKINLKCKPLELQRTKKELKYYRLR
ncbi:hypothetical protein C0J52_05390 [Blattella germanica]|nr:hypothetical protein C0J52_05390 [Blattella germanica]